MTDEFPTFLPEAARIVVIGDLHGDVARLMRSLQVLGVINGEFEWTAEPRDTVVVQLGDQLDSASRAPVDDGGGWERLCDIDLIFMMDRLDAIARPHGGRVISLLGNHEFLNVLGAFDYVSERSLLGTGGAEVRRARLEPGSDLARRLARRGVVLCVGRNVFCHAALLPHHMRRVNGDITVLNALARKFLRHDPVTPAEKEAILDLVLGPDGVTWSRAYVEMARGDPAALGAALDEVLVPLGAASMFVGHNTVDAITAVAGGRLWFCDAQFSRAFGRGSMQVLDVQGDAMRAITITEGPGPGVGPRIG